jgi:ankyrin repeat protein
MSPWKDIRFMPKRFLRDHFLNPNKVGGDDMTRLQRAIKEGDVARVHSLLLSGADVNYTKYKNMPVPIVMALEERQPEIFDILLKHEKQKIDFNKCFDGHGEKHILVLLAQKKIPREWSGKQFEFMQAALLGGAAPDKVVEIADEKYTPLFLAAMNDNKEAFKQMYAFSDKSSLHHSLRGELLVHVLARAGAHELLAFILEDRPALVNAKDEAGLTVLHHAINSQNLECLKAVLKVPGIKTAQVNNDGHTPLHYAILKQDLTAFHKILASYNAEAVNAKDGAGYTALHLVAGLPSLAADTRHHFTQALLRAGAKVEVKDALGFTPLHILARYGKSEDLRTLDVILKSLKPRELINQFDEEEKTALFTAAVDAFLEVQEKRETSGKTVKDILDIVDIFLDYGANPSSPDWRGYTALDRLAEKGDRESLVVQRLIKAGGKYRKMFSLDELQEHNRKLAPIPKQADENQPHEHVKFKTPNFKM